MKKAYAYTIFPIDLYNYFWAELWSTVALSRADFFD